MPHVSILLKAARDSDENLLRDVLHDILSNGISATDLNVADTCGRTALSYICSTNLTHILDILLQISSLDINYADTEGNTPLHFAAQAGQSDIVNMLLTRSRSISIDAKNQLGFTPLMKAALQGRTRCAKLLLFAGASPVVIDNGRGFRAEQWARFCGRFTCAEMIETCARTQLMDKGTSCHWAHDAHTFGKSTLTSSVACRSSQQSESATNGFRSKLRKVFSFTLKDRLPTVSTKKVRMKKETDLPPTQTIRSKDDSKATSLSITNKYPVPKFEITPANNQKLIRKYEQLYGKDNSVCTTVDRSSETSPKLPPRSKVRSRM